MKLWFCEECYSHVHTHVCTNLPEVPKLREIQSFIMS